MSRKKSSEFNSDFCDLTPIAHQFGIPVFYSKNINDAETIKWIERLHPDIIFCFGISQLIKKELLALPPLGIVGVHPTLLPRNRGRHPIIWSLSLGLDEGGLTFFFMDEGADSGGILSQKKFAIAKNDTAQTLFEKTNDLAREQITEFLPKLISGKYEVIKQIEDNANSWRKRSRKDGTIDWRMGQEAILNLIRALTKPYPGAEFKYNEQTIIVWKADAYAGQVDRK